MEEKFTDILKGSPFLKNMFENATINGMQVMDTDGYILHVNEAFQHAFGYTSEDLYGKHFRILFTQEDQKMLLPEMEIERVKQHGSATDRNYVIHKDRSCVWASGESLLAEDEKGQIFIIKIIQNIHEQKVLEKFVKESQEFSESVVRSINDALIVVDTNFKILKLNNAFYNLFQLNQQTVEGLHLSELKHSFLSSGKLRQQLEDIIESGSFNSFQMEWKNEDETHKTLHVKASFLDGKMVDKRVLLLFSDITDKVQAEQQRDDMISFVVHELRNPLANLTLCNTLLEQSLHEGDTKGADELFEKARLNTTRLHSLIAELYDATKAGSGNMQFSKSFFNFGELVQQVIDATQLANPDHTIHKTGEANVDIYADSNRLHQVLTNYLVNAIKYSPEADRVDVHLSVENGNIIVEVTDYGKGIPPEKISHVFDRYYRADASVKIEGLGLGLFLCKQIIDAHNGRVWITSKLDEGSTFYFSIPM